MRHLAVLAIVVVAAPAFAGDRAAPAPEPPRAAAGIRIGPLAPTGPLARRRVDRADARVLVRRDDVVVELDLVLSTPGAVAAAALALEVPSGTRAIDLVLGRDGGELRGEAIAADAGRRAFERVVRSMRDPALLEWTHEGAVHDTLTLAVAPLTATPTPVRVTLLVPRTPDAGAIQLATGAPGTVELRAESGSAAALALGAHTRGDGDAALVATTRRRDRPFEVSYGAATPSPATPPPGGAPAAAFEPAAGGVSPSRSLYASAREPDRWAERRVERRRSVVPDHMDARTIRAVVRSRLPAIGHCFQQSVQRDWHREGTVLAEWMIRPDGTVASATTSGEIDDPELGSCVTDVIAGMRFPPDDYHVVVHYPFTFALAAATRVARDLGATPPEPLPADVVQPPR